MSDNAAEAIFNLRWTLLGLSQQDFAVKFGMPLGTVRNIEQARGAPKQLARLVLAAIELDPDLMELAAQRLIPIKPIKGNEG